MKWLVTSILFISISKSFACDCANVRFDEAYRRSSHVVSGKIMDISTFELNPSLLKVQFHVYENFKGSSLSEFYIVDPKKADGMCHVYLKKGQEMLVYLTSIEDEFPSFGYCSRSFSLSELKERPMEIEILRKVRESQINYTSSFFIETYKNEFFQKLYQLELNASNPKFGIYEVEIDHLNFWTNARVLDGINTELDQMILELIESSKWEVDSYYSDRPIPTIVKFFLVIENEFWETTNSFQLLEFQ